MEGAGPWVTGGETARLRAVGQEVALLGSPVQRERLHEVLHRQVGRVPAVQDGLDDGR